jgi:hypothetical protein
MQLIRILLLVFSVSNDDSVVDRIAFSVAVGMFSEPWQDIFIAVAFVESGIVHDEISRSGACCSMQLLGGRYDNAQCDVLIDNVMQCVAEAAANLAKWKYFCGSAYLDAYHGGWGKCKSGWWYEKNKRRTDVDWCEGADCYLYSDKVKRQLKIIGSIL